MTRKASQRQHADDTGDVLTYQDALDEAIEETFPASDPIAPAVANAGAPVSTRRNATDWKLEHSTKAMSPKTAAATRPRATRPIQKPSPPGEGPDLKLPTAEPDASAELDAVYRALKRGVGREDVTDANVDALIDLARERGDTRLEVLLREWRSACGDDPDMPATP